MTAFLDLAKKLRRECGVSNNGPTTVINQTGTLENVVNWTIDSYRDIQLRSTAWRWMRSNFTVNTVASDDTYAYADCTDTKTGVAISRFSAWWANDKLEPFKIYLTSGGVAGEYWLRYMPYELFRRLYKFGVQQSQTGQPIHVSVDDDDQIVIGPNPNAVYTISGCYQRGPQMLAADVDIPDMPERFHDLIVYYAMEHYAVNKVAPEVLAAATLFGGRMMRSLERSQLPTIRLARPMA